MHAFGCNQRLMAAISELLMHTCQWLHVMHNNDGSLAVAFIIGVVASSEIRWLASRADEVIGTDKENVADRVAEITGVMLGA